MKSFALTIVLSLLLFSNHSLFTSEQASYVCNLSRADGTICNKSFIKQKALRRHQKNIHNPGCRCPHPGCNKKVNEYRLLRSHTLSKHEFRLPFMNDLSDESYEKIFGHPPITKWYCPMCSHKAPFSTYSGLCIHYRRTENHPPLKALPCLKAENPELYNLITKGPSYQEDESKTEADSCNSSQSTGSPADLQQLVHSLFNLENN